MRKLVTTMLIALPLLITTSLAQAHSTGRYSGIQTAVKVVVPIGQYGYAVPGPLPRYYPAPYVRYGYLYRPGHDYRQNAHRHHHANPYRYANAQRRRGHY